MVQTASLVVQWLRLCPPSAEGPGSIPGQEMIPHAITVSSHDGTKDPTWCSEDQRSCILLLRLHADR